MEKIEAVGLQFDTDDWERAYRRLTRQLDDLEDRFDDTFRSVRRQEDRLNKVATGILAAAGAWVTYQAAADISGFILETNLEFEQLEARLVSITGSTERAAAAFSLITNFARSTPFEVQNLVEAFTTLSAVGLQPTRDDLHDLGNFAAALGRDITDFINAVTRAAVGETEALKSFGVVARSEGEKLRITFRGTTREVSKDFREVVDAFREIAQQNFADGMERQMLTVGGAISNLKDSTALLAREIGRAGLTGELNDLVRTLDQAISDGSDFAEVVGGAMADGVSVANAGLEVMIQHIDTIVVGLEAVAGAAAGRLLLGVGRSLGASAVAAGGLRAALSGLAGGPAGAVAAVAGALAFVLLPKLLASREEAERLTRALSGPRDFSGFDRGQIEAELELLERRRQILTEALIRDPGSSELRDTNKAALVQTLRDMEALHARLSELNRPAGGPVDTSVFDKLAATLAAQRAELEGGERAAFAFRLQQEELTDTQREALLVIFDQVAALEVAKKAREDEAQETEQNRRAIDSTLTGLRRRNVELQRGAAALLRMDLAARGATEGEIALALSLDQANQKIEEQQRAAERLEREALAELEAELQTLKTAADRMAGEVSDALLSMPDGVVDAFRDMVDGILAELIRLTVRKSITEPLSDALAGALGAALGSSGFDLPTSSSGNVDFNVPSYPGNVGALVAPGGGKAGAAVVVNQTIQSVSPDAATVAAHFRRHRHDIAAAVIEAVGESDQVRRALRAGA